jgi:hypothetical protein
MGCFESVIAWQYPDTFPTLLIHALTDELPLLADDASDFSRPELARDVADWCGWATGWVGRHATGPSRPSRPPES